MFWSEQSYEEEDLEGKKMPSTWNGLVGPFRVKNCLLYDLLLQISIQEGIKISIFYWHISCTPKWIILFFDAT